jgi:drug/metabolite transporter (DMT)-like permease
MAMQPGADSDRVAMAATAVTVLLWASSFVAIRSAGHHFGPGALALGRLLAGSAVLGVIAGQRRITVTWARVRTPAGSLCIPCR